MHSPIRHTLTRVRHSGHPAAQIPIHHQMRLVPRQPIDGRPIPRHVLPVIAHHGAAQHRRSGGRHQQRDQQKDQRRRRHRTRQRRRLTAAAVHDGRRRLGVSSRLTRHGVHSLHGSCETRRHIQIVVGRRVLVVRVVVVEVVVVVLVAIRGRRRLVVACVVVLVSHRLIHAVRIVVAGRLFVQRLIVVLMVVPTDDRPAARRVGIATVARIRIGTGRRTGRRGRKGGRARVGAGRRGHRNKVDGCGECGRNFRFAARHRGAFES